MKNIRLLYRFLFLIGFLIISFGAIAVYTYRSFENFKPYNQLIQTISSLDRATQNIKNSCKELNLSIEAENENSNSINLNSLISRINNEYSQLSTITTQLIAHPLLENRETKELLSSYTTLAKSTQNHTNQHYIDYKKQEAIKNTLLQQLNLSAKDLKKVFYNDSTQSGHHYLKLRGFETDYLLNKNENSLGMFRNQITSAKYFLKDSIFSNYQKSLIRKQLSIYENNFLIVANHINTSEKWKAENNYSKIEQNLFQLESKTDQLNNSALQLKETNTHTTLFTLGKIILAAMLMAIFLCVIIIKIVYQIVGAEPDKVFEIANNIANGHLIIEKDNNEKTKGIYHALKRINNYISNLLLEVNSILNTISTSNEILSKYASEQFATSKKLSTNYDETLSINQNTLRHINSTKQFTKNISESITQGTNQLDNTLQTLMKITANIQIIEEIADKTDLLAINASIEASGAGIYGKRFSIVASEIRKLSDRCRIASQQIKAISKTTISGTTDASQIFASTIPTLKNNLIVLEEIEFSYHESETDFNQVSFQSFQDKNAILSAKVLEIGSLTKQIKDTLKVLKLR